MSDKKLGVKDLSSDQLDVYESIINWSKGYGRFDHNLLTVGGYAGTGKTSLLGVFASNTDLKIAYVSFTGRASSILARKLRASGAVVEDRVFTSDEKVLSGRFGDLFSTEQDTSYCGTIHRLLYRPLINSKTDELLGWSRRDKLDRDYDLIVIDEASMVGDSMLEDIQVFEKPIIAVGDHGQLPPVMDEGSLMKNPMLRLEKIHRQAQGNPVIQLAHRVRLEGVLDRSLEGKGVAFGSKGSVDDAIFTAYKLSSPMGVGVICWTNKSRVKLNGVARKALGYKGAPKKGEIVICLKNKSPVYNGMRGVLTLDSVVGQQPWELVSQIAFPDEGLLPQNYMLCAAQFNREKTYAGLDELVERGIDVESMKQAGDLYDFGYAMTCHKSQGSSFEHVVVYLDRPEKPWEEEYRRWMYTAVTRSSEKLTVLT